MEWHGGWHDWSMAQSDDRSTTGVYLITIRPCHRLGHENSTNWSGLGVHCSGQTAIDSVTWTTLMIIVLLGTSRDRMQQLTETVETEGKKIGLQMNVKKCKTLVSDSWEDSREIRIRSTEVENVGEFCYLGSWLSTNGNCDKDCEIRVGKANSVFGRLQHVRRNKVKHSLKVKK